MAREQWRLLFDEGGIDKNARPTNHAKIKAIVGSAARVQMLTRQVTGQLASWISNRQNEFRDAVNASSLDVNTRHQLHTINISKAWFGRESLKIHGKQEIIQDYERRLARKIMKSVMSRHSRPSWSGLGVQLDQREVRLLKAKNAFQDGRVTWWADIIAAGVGKASIPLIGTPPHLARAGKTALTLQINRDRDNRLTFGVVTDVTADFEKSRSFYEPKTDAVGLDFGLRTLFATDQGDLIGQGFLEKLKSLDSSISAIAKHIQRSGGKLRDSKRYRSHTQRMRGFIRTEVNRVLNRLVETHAPGELLLEKLDFRSPELSRRMNRLVQNCGRSVIKVKLEDLEERFGIVSAEVDPAYTSQQCSSCGYVHASSRNGERFTCRRCGLTLHADTNAARNIRQRRSLPVLDEALLRSGSSARSLRGRRHTLERLRQSFERRHGPFGPCRTSRNGPAADSQEKPLRFAWDEVKR